MSEAENPELLGRAERGHGGGHPGARRRLHPALRAAGPQPGPAADRALAGRPSGPARRRAQDRPARGALRASAATRAGLWASAIEEPRARRLAAQGAALALDQHLPRGGRPDRRRAPLGPAAGLRRARGPRDLHGRPDPRPPRPPGRRQGRLRGARGSARLPRRRRRRDGGTAAGSGGSAQPPVNRVDQAPSGRGRPTGSTGSWTRATRSPASASSTRPATRAARWSSSATPTGSRSAAT